jgi:hypothetical protein
LQCPLSLFQENHRLETKELSLRKYQCSKRGQLHFPTVDQRATHCLPACKMNESSYSNIAAVKLDRNSALTGEKKSFFFSLSSARGRDQISFFLHFKENRF